MNPLLITIAILPGLLICYFIYRIDKYDKESHWHLIIAFILGMLVTIPAMKLEEWGESFGLEESGSFWMLVVLSYIVVGLSEEFVKFCALSLYAYPQKSFNEPLDGIVYAVMIGMGFATLENVIYADRFGLETIVLRAFTSVPAHGVFAVFMGYYLGLAKFKKKNRPYLIFMSLLIPILLHGTYDFFILQEYYDWLMGFATLTLFVGMFFAFKLIRLHQENSPFKNQEIANTSKNKINQADIEEAQIIAAAEQRPIREVSEESSAENNDLMDAVIEDMLDEEE